MHASSFPETWHHWRDRIVYGMHPHMADPEHPTRLADNPLRAGLRPVRLIPLVVPGMAILLLCCVVLIGSLLR